MHQLIRKNNNHVHKTCSLHLQWNLRLRGHPFGKKYVDIHLHILCSVVDLPRSMSKDILGRRGDVNTPPDWLYNGLPGASLPVLSLPDAWRCFFFSFRFLCFLWCCSELFFSGLDSLSFFSFSEWFWPEFLPLELSTGPLAFSLSLLHCEDVDATESVFCSDLVSSEEDELDETLSIAVGVPCVCIGWLGDAANIIFSFIHCSTSESCMVTSCSILIFFGSGHASFMSSRSLPTVSGDLTLFIMPFIVLLCLSFFFPFNTLQQWSGFWSASRLSWPTSFSQGVTFLSFSSESLFDAELLFSSSLWWSGSSGMASGMVWTWFTTSKDLLCASNEGSGVADFCLLLNGGLFTGKEKNPVNQHLEY